MQDLSIDLSCIEEEHPTPRKESTAKVDKKIGIENILHEIDRREILEATITRMPSSLPPKDPNAQGPRKTVFKKFFKVNPDSIIKPRQKLSPIVLSNLDLSAEHNPETYSTGTSRSPKKNQDSGPVSFTNKILSVDSLPQVQLKDATQLGSLHKFSSVKPSAPFYQPPSHIKLTDNSNEESFSKNQLMGKIKPRRMNTNIDFSRGPNINMTLMTPTNNRTSKPIENDYEFTPGSLKENLIKANNLHGSNPSLIPKKNSSINFELPYISSHKGIFRPQFNVEAKKDSQRYNRNNTHHKEEHDRSQKEDNTSHTTAYQYTEDSPRAASKLNYNSPDEIVSRGSDFALKNILDKRSTRNLKSMLNSSNSGIDLSSRLMTDFSPKAYQPLPISFSQTKTQNIHIAKIQDHNSVFKKVAEHSGLTKPIYYA